MPAAEADVVEDPVFGMRLAFRRRADAGGAEVLAIDMEVVPGGGVPPHVHPGVQERFRVESGRCEFLAGRAWREAGPGEEAVVPPGTRHAFRNRGTEVAHVICEVSPPDPDLQGFLEDSAALSRAGRLMRPGLPRGLDGALAAAALAKRYRSSTLLLFPPPIVQRLLLDPLVPIAERRGHRARAHPGGAGRSSA